MANWEWLKRKLDPHRSAQLRNRCVAVRGGDMLKLRPCYVFGRLVIPDEDTWWEGLEEGVFVVIGVFHVSVADTYYDSCVALVQALGLDDV
ncbi:MAG: hypothetical protein ACYDC2_11900 [Solirubrobacteraceae bacterium]